MKFVIIILMGILASTFLASCSFKASKTGTNESIGPVIVNPSLPTITVDPTKDSDGDGITDLEELKAGRNPFVADLPSLKVSFIQNYKISVDYMNQDMRPINQNVVIDTKVGASDPDFKYRVGKIFVRENAYKSAASVGRFSSHTEGEIVEHDYSWVKYPDVDPEFYHKKAIDLTLAFTGNSDFQNISVNLESSVQLLPNRSFDSINNLEVSFYFYDYEKETYELLSTKKIERHFNAGVTETFEVALNNLPTKLIEDNYLKKGELIISEVTDYEIPSLKTTYKKLLASVKNATIPVAINTPLESTVYFVAVPEEGRRFSEIMTTLFDKGFKIETDKLIKVGQFENNLPDFTYLKEVADKDKLGKWFVFSKKLSKSFLDYEFKKGDYLTLSYITGSELASQSAEKVYAKNLNVSGGDNSTLFPLGNVGPNSKISIVLKGDFSGGAILDKTQEIIDTQDGSCGRNCFSVGRFCRWDIITPRYYSKPTNFTEDFTGDIEKLSLVLNDIEYSLKDLFKEENGKRKISIRFEGRDLFLQISDIEKIAPIKNFEENQLFLKIKTASENSFQGIKLSEVGRAWDGVGGCPFLTPGMALDKGLPIATESIQLDKIKFYHANAIRPDLQSKIIYASTMTFRNSINLSLSSSINNYFN